jgi:hypothetical protein
MHTKNHSKRDKKAPPRWRSLKKSSTELKSDDGANIGIENMGLCAGVRRAVAITIHKESPSRIFAML